MRAQKSGAWVGAKVQLVRQLAVGATSTVWLGRYEDRSEPVAVKLLDGRLYRTMGAEIVRFHREAKALEQLRSAHCVRLLEHGLTDDQQPYLVMELLRGQTLEARLRRDTRLPLADVTRLVQQLTAALGEAHELGIVHRDVTADNVFLLCAEQLVAKLLDFGLAKHMVSGRYAISTSDAMRGQARSVAPEMLAVGGEVDHRVDLWAVGALAFRALTGAHPFIGADYHEMVRRTKAGEILPLGQLGLDVEPPPLLDHFFSVALAPQPEDRFDSAESMAEAWTWAASEPAPDSASDWAETHMVVDDEDDFVATRVRETTASHEDDLATTRMLDDEDEPLTVIMPEQPPSCSPPSEAGTSRPPSLRQRRFDAPSPLTEVEARFRDLRRAATISAVVAVLALVVATIVAVMLT